MRSRVGECTFNVFNCASTAAASNVLLILLPEKASIMTGVGCWCAASRACGRLVAPSGVDSVMMDTQQADTTDKQSEAEACQLWCCSFCGAECSSAEIEQSCGGSVQITPAHHAGGAAPGSIHFQVRALM
jgi:hypothetical protein